MTKNHQDKQKEDEETNTLLGYMGDFIFLLLLYVLIRLTYSSSLTSFVITLLVVLFQSDEETLNFFPD